MSEETDYGLLAQKAAEAHLAELEGCLWEEGEGGNPQWPAMAGPYCGCETCMIRETLFAAWPHLRDAALAGVE